MDIWRGGGTRQIGRGRGKGGTVGPCEINNEVGMSKSQVSKPP